MNHQIPEDIEPFRALLDDYELLVRCARRCAYDLNHCVGMIDRERYSALKPLLESKADHWVDLFAKGNPGKDYRHDLLRRLHDAQDALEKIDNYFRSQGNGYPKELKSIFDGMFGIPF